MGSITLVLFDFRGRTLTLRHYIGGTMGFLPFGFLLFGGVALGFRKHPQNPWVSSHGQLGSSKVTDDHILESEDGCHVF